MVVRWFLAITQDNKNVILLDINPSLHDTNFLNAESLETVKGPEELVVESSFQESCPSLNDWKSLTSKWPLVISLQLPSGLSLQSSLVQIHFLQQVQNEKESFGAEMELSSHFLTATLSGQEEGIEPM